ncbi:PLC-like phosphodiesterase [Piromyces finnis]|uniref:PLC-like phosphodiesterase n=1 Tax=Piromyces finnis TaxID=1754191 RepID=A0A1Y1VFU9_9FUNG|nr:PLC-like phosphodiesterase [Piromyces finnis]|eukprot:ORX55294.1 PLC-like phosphodiesterase [Piromyces finnis]
MADIINYSLPFIMFAPIVAIFILATYIKNHYQSILEIIRNEESIIYNSSYQYGLLFVLLFLIYVLSSFVLSGFVIWKYKPKLSYPYENISNRGDRVSFIENTLEAIKRALNGGAQVVLIDVQLTADKKVVVLRHENISKLDKNRNGKITNLKYSELPKLSLNDNQKELPQNKDIDSKAFKIPILKDVFNEFSKVPIIINFVNNSTELVDIVNSLVKECDRESITIWGSFNHENINKYLFKINKNIPIFFSKSRINKIVLYDIIGILPFLKINESVLITTQRTRDVQGYTLLKYGLNMHLNARGIPVFAYSDIDGVMNDTTVLERIRKLQINGIIADDSSSLSEYLKSVVESKIKEKNLKKQIKQNESNEEKKNQ